MAETNFDHCMMCFKVIALFFAEGWDAACLNNKFNAVIDSLLGLPGSDGPSAPGAAGVPF